MRERIFLNSALVVGFGDEDGEMAFYRAVIGRPVVGYFLGGASGAFLGALTKTRVWTGVGAVVGGAVGIVVGAASGQAYLRSTSRPNNDDDEGASP